MIRKIHRWLSFPLAIFFLLVTITGIYLQIVELEHGLEPSRPIVQQSSFPSDEVLLKDIKKAIEMARQSNSTFPSEKLEISYLGGKATINLATTNRLGPSMKVNLSTGEVITVNRPPRTLRTYFLLFHSGKFFGPTGTFIMLITGICLFILTITGIWEYIKMYKRRSKTGNKAFFW